MPMPSKSETFAMFARYTLANEPMLYPAIMKEVIHIESLSAMRDAGLFQRMVFQGGTAVRLCYGGIRYSEDLDFSAESELSREEIALFFDRLGNSIQDLGLNLDAIKEPTMGQDRKPGDIPRWMTRIIIPPFSGTTYGVRTSHHVKIEVDARPVHERVNRVVQVNHADLGQIGPIVATKSIRELLADKTLAFLGRNTMKWRDVFDMYFLRNQVRGLNKEDLLSEKLRENYADKDALENRIEIRRESLKESANLDLLSKELTPLMPTSLRDVWLSDDGKEALINEATITLDALADLFDLSHNLPRGKSKSWVR